MGSTANTAGSIDAASSIWEVALALLLVICAIFLLGWLLRRMQGGVIAANSQLRVVAALTLGPRERLLLVDVAGTQVLLGVTAQQITALREFEGQVVLPAAASGGDFAQRLKQALGQGSTS